jgi:hypothetical protein
MEVRNYMRQHEQQQVTLWNFFTFHADVWNFLKHNLLLFMLTHAISYFHADVWNFLLSMLTYGIS